jgi:hypothetical protein
MEAVGEVGASPAQPATIAHKPSKTNRMQRSFPEKKQSSIFSGAGFYDTNGGSPSHS